MLGASLTAPVAPGQAGEPVEAFLAALRERGYYDQAVDYLDRLAKSALIAPDWQKTLAYEQGVTLVQAALAQREMARKAEYLDRAQVEFERFRSQQSDHPLLLSANAQLGKILLERARIATLQAQRPGVDAAKRDALTQQARDLFGRAREVFQQNKEQLGSRLEQMPKALADDRDTELIKQRDQLRAEYVEAQFVAAMIEFELAQTHAPDSEPARQGLEAAEKAFGVVAEKYRRRVAGLSAVFFQGRCRWQLGDPKGALAFYEELLELSDDEPALRSLKTKALCHAVDCWLHADLKQLPLAIEKAEARLKQQRPDEQEDPDWLALQLRLAQAHMQQAAAETSASAKSERQLAARRLAVEVAKRPGETQPQAQELLSQLGQTATLPTAQIQAGTFAEALQAGQEILSQRQVAAGTVSLLGDRVGQISDPEQRREAETRLQEARTQLQDSDQKALAVFEQARLLADAETPLEDLNLVRFYLATLHYYVQDYYEAAVLAGFLARHFPDSNEGRRAGSVALAALVRLYGDGSAPYAKSLIGPIQRTAEDSARRFAGQPEAQDALATLVTISVQAGRVEEAERYLQQLPEDSPQRGLAELATGQALWNRSFAAPPAANDAAAAAQRGALKQQAAALLTSGLRRTENEAVTPAMVAAAMSLAQYALQRGEAPQALEQLTHPKYGPQTLAAQQHPLMQAAGMTQRAHTLVLLACIAELPQAAAPDEVMSRAMGALEALKGAVGDDAEGQRQLAATYLALAQNVREQIAAAPPAGRVALSTAFEQFLDRAAASASEANVLNWVAESYLGLGRGLVADGQLRDQGQPYFAKAIAIYQSMLERAASGQLQLDAAARLATESRLAAAYREVGKFSEAMDQFARILTQQPNQVYVQLEAAKTLQQWGKQGRADAYLLAIRGDKPDASGRQNTIWGYGRIARVVAANKTLGDMFHEARYRVAECRYEFALRQQTEPKQAALAEAERDIVLTARLYPELGGAERKAAYDQLLRKIQQGLGKKPTGLP